jgi:hypothetical protein
MSVMIHLMRTITGVDEPAINYNALSSLVMHLE